MTLAPLMNGLVSLNLSERDVDEIDPEGATGVSGTSASVLMARTTDQPVQMVPFIPSSTCACTSHQYKSPGVRPTSAKVYERLDTVASVVS